MTPAGGAGAAPLPDRSSQSSHSKGMRCAHPVLEKAAPRGRHTSTATANLSSRARSAGRRG